MCRDMFEVNRIEVQLRTVLFEDNMRGWLQPRSVGSLWAVRVSGCGEQLSLKKLTILIRENNYWDIGEIVCAVIEMVLLYT